MNKKGNKTVNKKEFQKRATIILEEFNLLINKIKFDPILETFKSNEILQEFYMKRIFEIIKVKLIFR
jgi:hypothetical protein